MRNKTKETGVELFTVCNKEPIGEKGDGEREGVLGGGGKKGLGVLAVCVAGGSTRWGEKT